MDFEFIIFGILKLNVYVYFVINIERKYLLFMM